MAKIDTVDSRKKLLPRKEPYWQRLTSLCYLGFRKNDDKGGTWVMRIQTEGKSERKYKALGTFTEKLDGDKFDAAKKAAETHLKHLDGGGSNESITVGQACNRLVQKYKDEGREDAAKDAKGRFKRWVHSNQKLATTPMQKLTASMLSDWRTNLAKTPSLSEILCARHNIPPKEFSCLAIQRQPLRAAKRPCRNSASKCSKSSYPVP